eukprot:jgi/Bigna1/89029/estExt_fgenesh1_pg.C_420124
MATAHQECCYTTHCSFAIFLTSPSTSHPEEEPKVALVPLHVPVNKDIVNFLQGALKEHPRAWITSCSGVLSTVKFRDDSGETSHEQKRKEKDSSEAEKQGSFHVVSLQLLNSKNEKAQRTTLQAVVLDLGQNQNVMGGILVGGSVAPGGLTVTLAINGSSSTSTLPAATSAELSLHPNVEEKGRPEENGKSESVDGSGLAPPPPSVKSQQKNQPKANDSIHINDDIEGVAGSGLRPSDLRKREKNKKNKTKRSFKIVRNKSKKGRGKTNKQDDVFNPNDTKLDVDRLFYEFRKLLLKNEMPAEKVEEWFDPKLVTAIRSADVNTGSGYVLETQLRDIVADWVLDQSAFYQLRFLTRHVTRMVIERFLNKYPKVKIDTLLVDPAVARMNEILDRYKGEGVDSRIRILDKDASLQAIVPYVKKPRQTVIALDFDQTITLVEKAKPGHKKARKSLKLRGGVESKRALESLVDQGAICCIATAQTPGVEVMISLVQEIRHLGLARVFNVELFDQEPIKSLIKSWGMNETMSLNKLTIKLVVLMSLNTSRKPKDMERIGYSMLKFDTKSDSKNKSSSSSSPLRRCPSVKFQLFHDATDNPSLEKCWGAVHELKGVYEKDGNNDDNNTGGAAGDGSGWKKNNNIDGSSDVMGSPISNPTLQRQNSLAAEGDVTMCTVRCMKAYAERTKELRLAFLKSVNAPKIPKVFIEEKIKKREADKSRRIQAGELSEFPPEEESKEEKELREAEEDRIRYEEEAIRVKEEEAKNHWSNRLFISADGKGLLDADTIDKMTKDVLKEAGVPPSKLKTQLSEPLMLSKNQIFQRNHTTPVTSFWYKPPKKSEVYNVQARKLVHELAKLPDPKPLHAKEDKKDKPSREEDDEKKTDGSASTNKSTEDNTA